MQGATCHTADRWDSQTNISLHVLLDSLSPWLPISQARYLPGSQQVSLPEHPALHRGWEGAVGVAPCGSPSGISGGLGITPRHFPSGAFGGSNDMPQFLH